MAASERPRDLDPVGERVIRDIVAGERPAAEERPEGEGNKEKNDSRGEKIPSVSPGRDTMPRVRGRFHWPSTSVICGLSRRVYTGRKGRRGRKLGSRPNSGGPATMAGRIS
jgi:hypothetical protein